MRLFLAENFNDIDDAEFAAGRVRIFAREVGGRVKAKRGSHYALARDDLITHWHGAEDGRVQCMVSPHAPELCSPELLRESALMAERHDIGSTIHLSQSHKEVEGVMRVRGVRPTQYLFANGLLNERLVVAHCRYVDDSEVALLGQHNVAVSNNAAIAARRGLPRPCWSYRRRAA